jgi:hypothetical protein
MKKENYCTHLDGHGMNLEIKLLRWPEGGNYVIAFCRGPLQREGFRRIFRRVDRFTQPLSNCKVMIDMRDSNYVLEFTEISVLIDQIVADVSSRDNQLAIVSAPGVEYLRELVVLSNCLVKYDFNIAVFTDMDRAASWLASTTLDLSH